ncbi:MAG: phosphotransferase family protein, partial [Erythrobacter sp.]|nr:phosphotransferase family protein [Erythrobacter sp.]
TSPEKGEASPPEVIQAVSEWLATIKDRMEGHDRFQLAVARNALGIAQRDWSVGAVNTSVGMSESFLADEPLDPEYVSGLFPALRRMMLDKIGVDSPKYASLAVARSKWLGGN